MKPSLLSLIIFLLVVAPAVCQSKTDATSTYRSEKCDFSFSYPSAFTIQEKSISPNSRCHLHLVFLQAGKVKHAIALSREDMDFDAAAAKIGVDKSQDGWVSTGPEGNAEDVSGSAWKGVSLSFAARCYGNGGSAYQGTGEGQIGFANSGNITWIIDGGSCEHSDPDAYQWVITSLKFS